jgi:hypothetical protein
MALEQVVAFGTIYKTIGWQSESRNNLCEGSFFRSSKRLILLKRGQQKLEKPSAWTQVILILFFQGAQA